MATSFAPLLSVPFERRPRCSEARSPGREGRERDTAEEREREMREAGTKRDRDRDDM